MLGNPALLEGNLTWLAGKLYVCFSRHANSLWMSMTKWMNALGLSLMTWSATLIEYNEFEGQRLRRYGFKSPLWVWEYAVGWVQANHGFGHLWILESFWFTYCTLT